MPTLFDLILLLATVGSGLTAGLCFAFSAFILRALDGLGAPGAIRAMQVINAGILRSSAMVVWFGAAVAAFAAVAVAEERAHVAVATTLYALGALLITGRGNVPLNEELARVDPDGPEADRHWRRYRVRWGRWNALRTLLVTSATALFAMVL